MISIRRIPLGSRILTVVCLAAASPAFAQTIAMTDLPDAPLQAAAAQQARSAPSSDSNQQQQPADAPQPQKPPQDSGKVETKEEQRRRAEAELKQQEKQRILGVMPNFNSTNNAHAAPLSSRQKFELDLRSSVDPFVFVAAGLDAAMSQAENDFPEYGQGIEGYAKRLGASYADTFDGNLWGNAILPSLLHEDPRYFRKGTGSIPTRALYAAAMAVWCKRDNGTWGPSYANVGGNLIAGGISNLYYPASDRGFTLTVTRALTVTAEGAIGSELVEFWPDISRRLFHRKDRIPTNRTTVQPEGSKPVEQMPPPAGAPQT